MINEEKKETVVYLSKPRKPYVFTNVLSKLILMHIGKRDGKKGIPSDANNSEWMSPTLRKEYAKIDERMAKILREVDKKCGELYADTEILLSDFVQNETEIEKIYSYIIGENITYKEVVGNSVSSSELSKMLNAKRQNENKCDELGLRLRRYNEHNKAIQTVKERYYEARNKLKIDYQQIMKNYQMIITLENEIDIFFLELCSNIERRTSWYWQGVLLKHPHKNTMPQTAPKYNNNNILNFNKQRREELTKKISNIEICHKKVLELDYVE